MPEPSSNAAKGASRRSVISLHTLSLITVLVLTALSLGNALLAVWTSDLVRSSLRDADRARRKLESVRTFEGSLREHQLVGSLWTVTRDDAAAGMLVMAEANLSVAAAGMVRFADRDDERRVLSEIQAGTAELREARRRAAPGVGSEALARQLQGVAGNLGVLRAAYEDELLGSRVAARRALRMQTLASYASAALILAGLVAASLVLKRCVLEPIFRLQAGVNRYRPGEGVYRIDGGPAAETRELAERFNELTRTIERQHADQLTYLAAVAHDLRNPLSTLLSFAAFLQDDRDLASMRARFERQVERMNRMVSDLLDATRIESGNLELRLEAVDLGEVVRSAVALYEPTASTHEISLDAPGAPLVVRGDSLRLDQVVTNLVANAVKYSPAGRKVSLRLSRADGSARLEVEDQGMGIAESELAELFAPFKRLSGSKAGVAGVGLGLSICRRIVEAHGGTIRVRSRVGAGSTFTVELPLSGLETPKRAP